MKVNAELRARATERRRVRRVLVDTWLRPVMERWFEEAERAHVNRTVADYDGTRAEFFAAFGAVDPDLPPAAAQQEAA